MEQFKVLTLTVIFLIGFVSSALLLLTFDIGPEEIQIFNKEKNSTPFDSVADNDILVYPDRIVIKIDDASIGRYAPTGSMLPVLDEGTNGIRIVPQSESEIYIGDIITFRQGEKLIIHRVIEKGIDTEGTYFITKGDNNLTDDGKIRFENIKYKTIGLIY